MDSDGRNFHSIFPAVIKAFRSPTPPHFPSNLASHLRCCFSPQAIVLQLGADALLVTGELVEMCSVNARLQRLHPFTNRPCSLGGCNLSSACFPRIVQSVSALHLPLLILGGGGYNEVATVKAWVAATAAACGAELPGSVPLHDFYAEYGPTFCFQHVSAVFIFVIAQSTLVTVHNFTGLQRLDAR